tara:strand:+ start:186 stop:695 length:510 start_codon:yes stop_codon:yes gene_type:complete
MKHFSLLLSAVFLSACASNSPSKPKNDPLVELERANIIGHWDCQTTSQYNGREMTFFVNVTYSADGHFNSKGTMEAVVGKFKDPMSLTATAEGSWNVSGNTLFERAENHDMIANNKQSEFFVYSVKRKMPKKLTSAYDIELKGTQYMTMLGLGSGPVFHCQRKESEKQL